MSCRPWCACTSWGCLRLVLDLLDLRKSALRHHLEVVEGATEALLSGSHQRRLLDQIAEHYPNFRSSLAFALEEQDFVSAARLAEGLWRFWELRGMLAEGRSWLERCLKGGPLPPELRVRLLDGAGMLAWRQGDFSDATRYFGEALACCGASNPTIPMRGRLHNHAGLVELFSGNLAAAISDLEVALAEPEAAQCPGEAAAVRANLALAAIERGRLFEAMRLAEEALAVQVAGGDRHGQAVCLLHRAIALYYSGEPSSAAGEARVAAGIFEELGDNRNLSFCLLLLAGCLAETHPGLAV